MKRLTQITRAYRETGAMSDLIPLYGFVDDGVFLTKGGDLGAVLALGGIDYECLDAQQRELVTTRFEVALRLLDERTRLYQYVLKRNRVVHPDTVHPHPAIDEMLRHRHEWLQARHADLFGVLLYLVIVVASDRQGTAWLRNARRAVRQPLAAAREAFSTTRKILRLDEDLDRRRVQLRHKVDAFIQQLEDTVRPRMLAKHEAFGFFRRLMNYDPDKADRVGLRQDDFLDFHVCDAALECHRTHLRLDDHYVRVLTLKEPPAQTFPLLFQALYEIPSNLVLASEWQREGQGAVRREIHAKRRHFHNARVSLASYVTDADATPAGVLVDDSANAVVRELGAALTELTLQGRYFGQYTLTVILYDRDPDALERSVGACLKAFAAHDAQATDERYNLFNAWLSVLPGNTAYNVRSMHLLNTNYADLSLLFAQSAGSETNTHLGRESLAVLDSTQGTPYHLNLHVGDVGHTLVLGATGSGKSFLLNFLVGHLQRYSPRTLIFDLGGSYEGITRYFGGQALKLALDRPFSINPFCLEPTPDNLQFLFTFVKVLIQSGVKPGDAKPAERGETSDQALYEQIETLYALDPDERRLFTLASILPRGLAQRLQRWVGNGQYAQVFDRVEDTVTLAPFQYVDFEGLDGVPLVLEPLLFYLLHRATATIADPSQVGTLKVFVLDEAWRFLRDPTIRAYVTEALKTWRKKNACVLMATQSSEDLQRSELLRVAIESCPTKMFLANPHIDQAVYQDLFHLNETEAARIATLVPRQELLLKQPHVARVLNLRVDPHNTALFGAMPRA
jgi:type IV secretion system protein VirB4